MGIMSGEMFLFCFFGAVVFLCIVVAVVIAGTVASTMGAINNVEESAEEE